MSADVVSPRTQLAIKLVLCGVSAFVSILLLKFLGDVKKKCAEVDPGTRKFGVVILWINLVVVSGGAVAFLACLFRPGNEFCTTLARLR